MKFLLIFSSIHQVMKAEKLLKGRGFKVDLIPMPREISSDCGVAIEVSSGCEKEALDLLNENRLPTLSCYTVKEGKYEKVAQE